MPLRKITNTPTASRNVTLPSGPWCPQCLDRVPLSLDMGGDTVKSCRVCGLMLRLSISKPTSFLAYRITCHAI